MLLPSTRADSHTHMLRAMLKGTMVVYIEEKVIFVHTALVYSYNYFIG